MGFGRKIINILTGRGKHPDDIKDTLIKLRSVSLELAEKGYTKRNFQEFGKLMYSFQKQFQKADKKLVDESVFKVIDLKTQELVDLYAEIDEKIPSKDENVKKDDFVEEFAELNKSVNEIEVHFEKLKKELKK